MQPQPTPSELDIMNVLWAAETATVREVYEAVKGERDIGYTAVLKTMQNMVDKGLATRDTRQRSHVYRAAVARGEIQRGLVSEVLNKAFGGSLRQFVLRAVEEESASPEELREIQKLLDDYRKQR